MGHDKHRISKQSSVNEDCLLFLSAEIELGFDVMPVSDSRRN